MKLKPDMSIIQRQSVLEDALAQLLNRGPEMSVEPGGEPGTLFAWVIEAPHSNTRTGISIDDLARELEVLLS